MREAKTVDADWMALDRGIAARDRCTDFRAFRAEGFDSIEDGEYGRIVMLNVDKAATDHEAP